MYKTPIYQTTSITIEEFNEGESLEQKIDRILTHNEPIKDEGVQLTYTERKKGCYLKQMLEPIGGKLQQTQ
jgi:hypothetical protein